MRYGAILLAVAAAAAPGALGAQSAPPADSVTLEQAVERALQHNPQMVQASGAVRTAGAAERSAFGAYLPTVAASAGTSVGGASRLGASPGLTTSGIGESYTAGLSVAWQLYTGGQRGAERARAAAESAAAEAGLVEQRYGVVLSTEQAFYEVLRARELVEVAQARIETAEEGVAAAEQRQRVGSATRSDALRAQLELNTARESLLEAQNRYETATFRLGRLIGADAAVGARAFESLQPRPLSVSAGDLVAELVAGAPIVEAAQAALRSADASISAARAQYLPSLSLSTGYDWSSQGIDLQRGTTGWRLGLGMSIPIFDGFQREESATRARVQQQVSGALLADTRRAVRADVERLVGNLRLAEGRIALNTEAVQVAEEDLQVQQDRYRLGASTILDLLSSQTALVQSRTDLVAARYDYQLARAELEALAGREL